MPNYTLENESKEKIFILFLIYTSPHGCIYVIMNKSTNLIILYDHHHA